jgi:hypothetical protein
MEPTLTEKKENSNGPSSESSVQEWIVTTTGSLITKVERLDRQSNERRELTREEYAGLVAFASAYTAYFSGIRDYAMALAAGNTTAAQAYYKSMTDYFNAFSQY